MGDRWRDLRFNANWTYGDPERVPVKPADLRALLDERDALVEALRPFAEHGQPTEAGEPDLLADLMRDRIVDWFGMDEFDRARSALSRAGRQEEG